MKYAAMFRTAIMTGALALTGCSNIGERIDRFAFESFGGTLISSPLEVTVKEIHLDNGKLLGQKIIVHGAVVNVGEHATHLVVADESARLLVVTTNLTDASDVLRDNNLKSFSVMGTLERGKKGLPYVLAKAIATTDNSGG